MHYPDTGIGFQDFASYKPSVDYPGVVVTNEWLVANGQYPVVMDRPSIVTGEDIQKRTGILTRPFTKSTETIFSIAKQCCENFLNQKNKTRSKCKGLLLATSAIDAEGLGLSASDCSSINEADIGALVQKTAEKIANALHIDGLIVGDNWACTTAAKSTQTAVEFADDLKEGEYFLMPQVEAMARYLNVADQNTGILFGDYTAVTAAERGATRYRILHAFAEPIEKGAENLIFMKPVDHPLDLQLKDSPRTCIQMPDGKKVMNMGSRQMIEAIEESINSYNAWNGEDALGPENIGLVLGHQPNYRFERTLLSSWRQKWPTKEPPLFEVHVEHAGNNFSASWARRMAELKQGVGPAITQNMIIAAPFVGAGRNFSAEEMTYGCILMQAGER